MLGTSINVNSTNPANFSEGITETKNDLTQTETETGSPWCEKKRLVHCSHETVYFPINVNICRRVPFVLLKLAILRLSFTMCSLVSLFDKVKAITGTCESFPLTHNLPAAPVCGTRRNWRCASRCASVRSKSFALRSPMGQA